MTTPEPPDHGIYRCVTGATIPKDQRTAGQPCPFCGRTLSLTPTVRDKTSKRPSRALVVVLAVVIGFTVVPVVLAAALFLGEDISTKFSEVGDTLQSTESGSDDERFVALIEDAGGQITAQELEALKARVALIDGFNTCEEFFEYVATEVPIEESGLLGLGIAAYSRGNANALIGECPGELAVNVRARIYGDDPTLDRIWDECESGLVEYCDLLFLVSPIAGSGYETFGSSCGGRSPGETEWCVVAIGDRIDVDSWRDSCRAGDNAACDPLLLFSSVGSDALIAKTCGGSAEESDLGCILQFGL